MLGFITPQPPEIFGGGGLCVLSHLEALKFCLGNEGILYIGPRSKTVAVEDYCEEVFYINRLSFFEKFQALSIPTFISTEFRLKKEQKLIDDISKRCRFFWVEFTKLGALVSTLNSTKKRVVCFAHNFEGDYYKKREKFKSLFFQQAIERNEIISLTESSLVMAHGDYLRYAEKRYHLELVDEKVIPPFLPATCERLIGQESNALGISNYFIASGSFNYSQDYERYMYLLSSVWPGIVSENSELFLCLIGSGFDKIIKKCFSSPNVILVNRPCVEFGFYKNAIAYINLGDISEHGVQIKNLMPMSCGLPLIGYPSSFSGYILRPFQEFIPIEEMSDLKSALKTFLKQPERNKRMRETVLKKYIECHSFQKGCDSIRSIIDQT